MKHVYALALSFLAVFGCGASNPGSDSDQDQVNETENAIVGGNETSNFPSVMAIVTTGIDGQSVTCTATLISRTVLLTAAHCVESTANGMGQTVAYRGAKIDPANALEVKAAYHHPKASATLSDGYDLAVVFLKKPVTGVAPMAFRQTALDQSFVGKNVRIVGFGAAKHGDDALLPPGTKRVATVPLRRFDNQFLYYGNASRNACLGDDGGPVIMNIDKVNYIIGVNSFGKAGCAGGDVGTRVDVLKGFINKYLNPNACFPIPGQQCEKQPTCIDGMLYANSCGPDACEKPLHKCPSTCSPSGLCSCDLNLSCKPTQTCIDNWLYPTDCGPKNCDNPVGPC